MFSRLAQSKRLLWYFVIVLLILGNLLVWILVFNQREGSLTITFYDVGQGDATLIQTPNGYNILVDGGPNDKVSDYLSSDLPINDRELDLVILTHPQSDHLHGLINVLKNFRVKKVLTSNASNSTSEYKLWIDTVSNQGLNLEFIKANESISVEDNLTLNFNWPKSTQAQTYSDLNQASVVFTLTYFDFDLLMTGDADSVNQPFPGVKNNIEVLKVPHHGSATSMKDEFIRQLNPEVSVISVGKNNRYAHPREETLKQLSSVNSRILRTDLNGSIKIVSKDGKWYTQAEK